MWKIVKKPTGETVVSGIQSSKLPAILTDANLNVFMLSQLLQKFNEFDLENIPLVLQDHSVDLDFSSQSESKRNEIFEIVCKERLSMLKNQVEMSVEALLRGPDHCNC
jgi:hypothetical protein